MNRDQASVLNAPRSAGGDSSNRARSGAAGFERWLVQRLLRRVDGLPVRVVLWNGEEIAPTEGPPLARIVLRDRGALYKLILNPGLQFGELYSEGRLRVEGNLVALMDAVCRVELAGAAVKMEAPRRSACQRHNSLVRARANIHHHYDIGNEFYRLWLDRQLVYTCAYFASPDATLEAAQIAKMDHICRKLRLRSGESVVEAGCGWGSLALHMARRHGVRVRAFNISREQVLWARERAAAEGLGGLVEFVEDDYRSIAGRFDAFVSVGMLEHVGPENFGTLGGVIDRCLAPTGRGLIHSIGRNRPTPPDAWITARIFPGGYPPSLGEMMGVFEAHSFSVLDVENLRLHYAATLRHWLERFEAHEGEVRRMFDDRFVRMWRLYLAGSQAAFTTGWMQLFQVVFTRAANNEVPLTREHLYRSEG